MTPLEQGRAKRSQQGANSDVNYEREIKRSIKGHHEPIAGELNCKGKLSTGK
jgi:hypothetical protein